MRARTLTHTRTHMRTHSRKHTHTRTGHGAVPALAAGTGLDSLLDLNDVLQATSPSLPCHTSIQIPDLIEGMGYSIHVHAGITSMFETVGCHCKAVPVHPAATIDVSRLDPGSATLTWTPALGATVYRLELREEASESATKPKSSQTTAPPRRSLWSGCVWGGGCDGVRLLSGAKGYQEWDGGYVYAVGGCIGVYGTPRPSLPLPPSLFLSLSLSLSPSLSPSHPHSPYMLHLKNSVTLHLSR